MKKKSAHLLAFLITLLLVQTGVSQGQLPVSSSTAQSSVSENQVQWMTIEEAMAMQETQPRKIMIDVYTQWCGPCRLMSQRTFTNKDVVEYLNKNYYAVKFDAEFSDPVVFKGVTYNNPDYVQNRKGRNGVHHLARYLNVTAYPTLVFLDEEGAYISPVVGYKTPAQLELFLKLFTENKYQAITTPAQWEDYQRQFIPTWSNE